MSLDELLIHPLSRQNLNAVIQNPPHALLLTGSRGIGLASAAQAVAKAIIAKPGAIQLVEPDEKNTITIEIIRDLYRKTRSRSTDRQVFVMNDAHLMSEPAQNAFLKLLEEPNQNIMFVLSTHAPHILLTTIRSRVQYVELKPVDKNSSLSLLQKNGITDAAQQAQLLFIAQGLPAELTRLAVDESYRQKQLQLAAVAKRLIAGSRYDQLVTAADLSKPGQSRDEVLTIIRIATQMLKVQLAKAQSQDLLDKIQILLRIEERIRNNGHIRSQLMLNAL